MRYIKVYVNPGIFEFEIEDSASNDEVEQMAWEELCNKTNWHWAEEGTPIHD